MTNISVEAFLDYREKVKGRTRRLLPLIPDDLLEHRTHPARFSLGDLARHLAGAERWMFVENALGRPSRYPGHGRELAEGLPAVCAYFDRLQHESRDLLSRLHSEDLERRCRTVGGAELPVWKWLRAMLEHEVHHRGQMYQMLGDLDIPTPPLFGLTEHEVRAASEGPSAIPEGA